MTRILALVCCLTVFATTAHSHDLSDAEFLAVCEPETLEINPTLLSPSEWAALDEKAAALPNATGRLWRIEAEGGAVSYLWGTMHSADTRVSNVPEPLKLLISDARVLMLESVAASLTMQDLRDSRDWADFYAASPNSVLSELPEPAKDALHARLQDFNIDSDSVQFMNPVFALEILLYDPCSDRLGSAGYPTQDMRIELLGADAGIALKALDAEDVLDELGTDPKWATAFRDTLTIYALYHALPEANSTFAALYLRGEIGRMVALDKAYLQKRFPDIDILKMATNMDRFLLEYRNREMARRARRELHQGDAIIAVGAYHLYGESGLVELLRDEGFSVERVHLPGEVE